jgi:hypothetical protein
VQYRVHRSPFFIDASDPQQELIAPAVKGTQNVLRAAAKAKSTLKRLILTSSVAGALLLPVSGSQHRQCMLMMLVHVLQPCMASMPHPLSMATCTRRRTGTRHPALRTGRRTT